MEIIARGIKHKTEITVIVTKKEGEKRYQFDVIGCEAIYKIAYIDILKRELKNQYLIAGTYIPPIYSDINILNVLESYYFDERYSIEAKGIKPMPNVEGRIY